MTASLGSLPSISSSAGNIVSGSYSPPEKTEPSFSEKIKALYTRVTANMSNGRDDGGGFVGGGLAELCGLNAAKQYANPHLIQMQHEEAVMQALAAAEKIPNEREREYQKIRIGRNSGIPWMVKEAEKAHNDYQVQFCDSKKSEYRGMYNDAARDLGTGWHTHAVVGLTYGLGKAGDWVASWFD